MRGEQRDRFDQDLTPARARGQTQPPLDERLLAALAPGCPTARGWRSASIGWSPSRWAPTRLSQAMAFPIDQA